MQYARKIKIGSKQHVRIKNINTASANERFNKVSIILFHSTNNEVWTFGINIYCWDFWWNIIFVCDTIYLKNKYRSSTRTCDHTRVPYQFHFCRSKIQLVGRPQVVAPHIFYDTNYKTNSDCVVLLYFVVQSSYLFQILY